jgi:hypothetical protein
MSALQMSAFEGKATCRFALQMSAYDPKRTLCVPWSEMFAVLLALGMLSAARY